MRKTQVLHSMSDLQRDWGVDRKWLSGFVRGAGVETFRGDKNSLAVDDQGREAIRRQLVRLGMIEAVLACAN